MTLSDKDVIYCCEQGMITPYVPEQVRMSSMTGTGLHRRLSYGTSSAGYDFRLDPSHGLHYFTTDNKHGLFGAIDPKNFTPEALEPLRLLHDLNHDQQWWELPPFSYALGLSLEYFRIPRDIVGVTLGKSTYARVGVQVNVTPAEPGWEGNLVVEMFNSLPHSVRIYAGEGIAQMMLHRLSSEVITSYADRDGKYQGQNRIEYAKV